MKNVIIFFRLSFMLSLVISCSNKQSKTENLGQEKTTLTEEIKVDNPALFLGSKTFGHFLQSCHKIGDYQQMLKFTSAETRAKFGDSILLNFYSNMQFSYPLTLNSIKWNQNKFTLYYSTNIDATAKTIQLIGVIQNDSSKLVLNNLDIDKPFVGM